MVTAVGIIAQKLIWTGQNFEAWQYQLSRGSLPVFLVFSSSEGARVTLHFLCTSPETWTVDEFCLEVIGMHTCRGQ